MLRHSHHKVGLGEEGECILQVRAPSAGVTQTVPLPKGISVHHTSEFDERRAELEWGKLHEYTEQEDTNGCATKSCY